MTVDVSVTPELVGIIVGAVSGAFGVGVSYMATRNRQNVLLVWKRTHQREFDEFLKTADASLEALHREAHMMKVTLVGISGDGGVVGEHRQLWDELQELESMLINVRIQLGEQHGAEREADRRERHGQRRIGDERRKEV